jgi:hypothetical protein
MGGRLCGVGLAWQAQFFAHASVQQHHAISQNFIKRCAGGDFLAHLPHALFALRVGDHGHAAFRIRISQGSAQGQIEGGCRRALAAARLHAGCTEQVPLGNRQWR